MLVSEANRVRNVKHLYHLAEKCNVQSILDLGLRSSEVLMGFSGFSSSESTMFLREHRPENRHLAKGILIRDQKPMPPKALAPALDDGMKPQDWYALLNSFVFMWASRDRMDRQRKACGNRPQVLLTFDAQLLLEEFGSEAFVSSINSGYAKRKPARRGRETFVPYEDWKIGGGPDRIRHKPPVEFVFRCCIPAKTPYLLSTEQVQ